MENNAKKSTLSKSQKKGKIRKARLTALDFFIVIILLVCVLGVVFRASVASLLNNGVDTVDITVSFKAEGLTEAEALAVKKGDTFYLDGELLGNLTSVELENDTKLVEMTDDVGKTTFVSVNDPEKYVVKGTLTVTASESDRGYIVGGKAVSVGKILNISSSSYSFAVTITEIPQK